MKKTAITAIAWALLSTFVWAHGGDDPPKAAAEARSALPDNALWVANGLDDTISVIELGAGSVTTTLRAGVNPHIISAAPDGRLIYVVNAGVHDRPSAEHASVASEMKPKSESDNDDDSGRSAREDRDMNESTRMERTMSNSLWIYEASSGAVVATVAVGMGPTHALPSPDGRWVYVTNTDEDSITVVDTSTWTVADTISGLPEPHDGEFNDDGTLLFLATAGDNTLSVVDTADRAVVGRYPVGEKPRGVAVGGASGETVFLTNKADGTLSVFPRPRTDETVFTYRVGDGPHALRVAPDGKTVYIALSAENAVAVFDVAVAAVVDSIAVGELPEQLDLSDDGRTLFVGNNADATVSIIDTVTRTVTDTIPVGRGAYGVQAVGPRSTQFVDLPKTSRGYARIGAVELNDALKAKEFTLINVHVPYAGDIPGTDMNIPFNRIDEYEARLPAKDLPVVVYCRSGSMSRTAAARLVALGFTNVVELDGGFNAWRRAGYSLVRRDR